MSNVKFNELVGKTITNVTVIRNQDYDDKIIFDCSDGIRYTMLHIEECCESVSINDINGDINELVGQTIIVAEERSNSNEIAYGSETWTFYTIRTIHTSIDIRWYGTSNGYYSESVSII